MKEKLLLVALAIVIGLGTTLVLETWGPPDRTLQCPPCPTCPTPTQ